MKCPICDSSNAKMERRIKGSFFGSLFGANSPSSRAFFICSNCKQLWIAYERDGAIREDDKAEIKRAREEWERRGAVGPDIVCNGYPGGSGAEVFGFNEKALSWLKANVHSGRWALQGQALQVPMEEVSHILAKAPEAGLRVKTNNI